MRKRNPKGATDSLRRARNMNQALAGFLKLTEKTLANETSHRIAEITKEKKKLYKSLRSIHEVRAPGSVAHGELSVVDETERGSARSVVLSLRLPSPHSSTL